MASIVIGIVVSIALFLTGIVIALIDRVASKGSSSFMTRTRWIVVLLVSAIVAVYIGDFVQDKHYTFKCIKLNRQHYANVHWLRLYSRAMAGQHAN